MGVEPARLSAGFWHSKRVLLTGHTGFKGAWVTGWLHRLGAKVTGISLPPHTTPNLFTLANIANLSDNHFFDIRDADRLNSVMKSTQPEIVFHMAAQSLVRTSYREPLETFSVNVMGTAQILETLRAIESVRVVIVITTDKVYQNLGHAYPYRETDPVGGHDPYSASKAAAEIVAASYRVSFLKDKGVAVASARAGNVIGGGDWCEDRLIPDAVRAWTTSEILHVRHPHAVRPWQHVLEALSGYLRLGEHLFSRPELAGAYNFGPQTDETATVTEVIRMARDAFGRGQIHWSDGSEGPQEANWLVLETAKARSVLGVRPRWELKYAIERTMKWYRQQQQGTDALSLCNADIDAYETNA